MGGRRDRPGTIERLQARAERLATGRGTFSLVEGLHKGHAETVCLAIDGGQPPSLSQQN